MPVPAAPRPGPADLQRWVEAAVLAPSSHNTQPWRFRLRGGPANSTLTIVMYLYQKGFQRFQMGYGSALAWLSFAIIFIITSIQFRMSQRWVVED